MEFLTSGDCLTNDDIQLVISNLQDCQTVKKREHNKTIEYLNIPCAFDIETTSYYYNNEKHACMYHWQVGLNGMVIMGRTWDDFIALINTLSTQLQLNVDKRIILWVHNLSFEFQFIRKLFHWEKVFAVDDRKPVQAITDSGIEFRCSYILSGYSLANLANQIHKYQVEKMVGDLDYSLMRHSKTPMTTKELKYCENDVRVVMAYIQEKIENEGLANIPLTKTGYVRNFFRKKCFRGNKKTGHQYKNLMRSLTIHPEEYKSLKRAFAGGFTHGNAKHIGKVKENVLSADFTSSYPAVMVMEKFPMSKGVKVNNIHSMRDLEDLCTRYCVIFDIELTDVEPRIFTDNPISASKCIKLDNPVINNGRVVFAEKLVMTVTETDFKVYKQFYNWSKIRVANIWRYEKAYLPTSFVSGILELYQKKTELKGVKGSEIDYLLSKEMINSAYGMIVTDIVRDLIEYNTEWDKQKVDLYEEIDKYNNSKSRFLYYPWGVYVTAYARRNLFTAIAECEDDYIYSDTDSVKITNAEEHMLYFKWYNNMVMKKLERACKFHHLDISLIKPKTIKGVEKPLGVWDLDDGFYTRFKTLGAKRYMVEEDGKINITVSGVNKFKAIPYLYEVYKDHDSIFNAFEDGLEIPAAYKDMNPSGKSTLTYLDTESFSTLTDYTGNTMEIHTLSGVHMENASYQMSLSEVFIEFLRGKTYL